MTDKWAEHKQKFCGCKDASRLNRCQGRNNCELPEGHPERVSAAPRQPEGEAASILLPALRQYMHNDGSGLLAGYEYERTQRIVAELQEERNTLRIVAGSVCGERDTLRQQLADSDAALRESRANDQAAMWHLADMRQQRDKLAGLLREAAQIIDRLKGDPVAAGEMLGDIDAALDEVEKAR